MSTSQEKAKTVWVLTTFFSPYKACENSINSRSFVSKELAQEAMTRVAQRLYKRSGIIQEAEDKYFEEDSMEIHFGENPEGPDYRREFGYCKIESTKLEGVESVSDKLWVLTIFFSPYKSCEDSTNCRNFTSKKLAQVAMKREAQHLYKQSGIIQEAEDKYFEEGSMEIHFGENPEGSDYRREFGYCKIESTKLEGVGSDE